MITSFFSSNKNGESNDDFPPPKKSKEENKKRNELTGYRADTVKEQIKLMKRNPEKGHWRTFEKMKIRHTIITKDWTYEDKTCREWILAPYGMVETLSKPHNNRTYVSGAGRLSPVVKEALLITDDLYDPMKMKLVVSNLGDLGVKEFDHISCKVCSKDFIPQITFAHRGKLPEEPSIVENY